MRLSWLVCVSVISPILLLTGCTRAVDSIRRTFGVDHYQPDEFMVVTYAPLTVPAQPTLLPPIQEDGIESRQAFKEQAAKVLACQPKPSASPSPEASLLDSLQRSTP